MVCDCTGGEGAEELSSPTAANGGGAAPTTGMDADKLARLEAKRKEKADKAAAKVGGPGFCSSGSHPVPAGWPSIWNKVVCASVLFLLLQAAAKAAKKEKGLILGVGSTQIRDRLLAASGAGICDAETMVSSGTPWHPDLSIRH